MGRWGETGVPRENHLTQPQAEFGLSHMWPVRGSNLHQSQPIALRLQVMSLRLQVMYSDNKWLAIRCPRVLHMILPDLLILQILVNINLRCPHNLYPLKSHFYIIKLEFTDIYIIFLSFALKQSLCVLVMQF